ncbi:MAG TPA: hypothetical protein DCQ29_01935 [Chitinophagaceae bacterium]|nr:hypothetical protein [Chitinophagaceae bacterium]
MNESIKELFDAIKTRVTNPLFTSFVFFFVTYNWEIFITLLFYKQELLIEYKKVDYLTFCMNHLSEHKSYSKPLLFAILYVVIQPIIVHLISLYKALIKKLASFAERKVEKGTFLPIEDIRSYSESLYEHRKEVSELREKMYELESKELTLSIQRSDLEKKQEQLNKLEYELNNRQFDLNAEYEKIKRLSYVEPRIDSTDNLSLSLFKEQEEIIDGSSISLIKDNVRIQLKTLISIEFNLITIVKTNSYNYCSSMDEKTRSPIDPYETRDIYVILDRFFGFPNTLGFLVARKTKHDERKFVLDEMTEYKYFNIRFSDGVNRDNKIDLLTAKEAMCYTGELSSQHIYYKVVSIKL